MKEIKNNVHMWERMWKKKQQKNEYKNIQMTNVT